MRWVSSSDSETVCVYRGVVSRWMVVAHGFPSTCTWKICV